MIGYNYSSNNNVSHLWNILKKESPPYCHTYKLLAIGKKKQKQKERAINKLILRNLNLQAINRLILGNLNLHKHVFDTSRDQIPPSTTTQLQDKIYQPIIIDIDINLNSSLHIKLKTKE